MKKISVLLVICVMFVTCVVFGQTHTQSLTFDDNNGVGDAGIYDSTDTFAFDIFLTFAGYSSYGFSLWFETTADAAPNIFLTGLTYGTTFDDPANAVFPLGFTLLESNGRYTTPNPSDLGSSLVDIHTGPIGPGTYFVGHLSISLSGLAAGTYILQSADSNPHASEVTDTDFQDNYLPSATYTITVIPEPSTFALLIVAAIGVAVPIRRRTVGKKSGA